jgi:hypothetical protein
LTGGDERCERVWLPRIQPLADDEPIADAALIIAKERYVNDALDWLAARGVNERAVWVASPWFNDSAQAMGLRCRCHSFVDEVAPGARVAVGAVVH